MLADRGGGGVGGGAFQYQGKQLFPEHWCFNDISGLHHGVPDRAK